MALLFRALRIHPLRLVWVAALLIAVPQLLAAAPPAHQTASTASQTAEAKTPADQSQTEPDRASSYYHYGLAHLYEEMAISAGRPDYATQAVEEYKLALDADPNSALLEDGLADLYFKIGRIKDAVGAAEDQLKKNPDDVAAHTLLGQVYLRSLGDMQGTQAGEMLQLAIAEYETIARLKPADLETKLLLGQLYALNHDTAKAEAEFKAAQKIDADSEEAVLRMAALYGEEGDAQRAVNTLSAVPVADRTARIEFALASSYDQLKKPKEAAAAYRRSLEIDPDNPDAERGLATALLMDGQLDEALKAFNALVAADPTDAQSEIRLSEIQRRQGHYDEALATLERAKSQVQDSLELSYNEALIYDALGKYGQATDVLTGILDRLHARRWQVLRAGEAEPGDLSGPAWHHLPRREQDGGGRGGLQADHRLWRRVLGTRIRRRDRCLSRRASVEGSNRGRRRSGEGAAQEPPRSTGLRRAACGHRAGGGGNRAGQGAVDRRRGRSRSG